MIGTIAVIDDDDAVRDSTRALLECYGYAVRDHPSAEDFLSQPGNHVDCMLVDQHLLGMSGLDLLERLRAVGDLTPALMITGRADPSMVVRADGVGAKLLHKPLDGELLMHAIENSRGTYAQAACDHFVQASKDATSH